MATNLIEAMEAAVRDGADLLPWTAQNGAVLADTPTENACLRALSNPVPHGLAFGIPLFHCPDPALPAVPLLALLANYKQTTTMKCDRCHLNAVSRHRLLVPMGASVVGVHMCPICFRSIDARYPDLDWS